MEKSIELETVDGYVKPIHADDMPLFMHCCGGMIAVKTAVFWEQYNIVFALHDMTTFFPKR